MKQICNRKRKNIWIFNHQRLEISFSLNSFNLLTLNKEQLMKVKYGKCTNMNMMTTECEWLKFSCGKILILQITRNMKWFDCDLGGNWRFFFMSLIFFHLPCSFQRSTTFPSYTPQIPQRIRTSSLQGEKNENANSQNAHWD